MNAGIHTMSMQDYQRDPAVAPSMSSHTAHILITKSPLHAWENHPRLNLDYTPTQSNEFDLGACSHAVLLEGADAIYPIEAPDWRTKAAKDARENARANGKIPVLAHKMPAILLMAETARHALASLKIDLAQGKSEQVLIWQEPGGAWCRARPDWMSDDRKLILDYKSTAGSAEPSAWSRTMLPTMGYDLQAVHYLRGNAATKGPLSAKWIFLVQENYSPFACSFVGLSPSLQDIAERKWDMAHALWQSCLARNVWNGYPLQVHDAEPAAWQIAQDDERRMLVDEKISYGEQG